MIIGICGFIGSGKDTVADYLVNVHQFRRESFANSLKDAVSAVFGWDRTLLEGRTKQAREWREQVDVWWAERMNMPALTPRLILQLWGTEVCRNNFNSEIWIASLENKLRKTTDDIVISDCRFPNEIKSIQDQGGKIIWVQRGTTPHWYTIAQRANCGDANAKKWLEDNGIHSSESAWAGTNFDRIINNNHSLDALYQQINGLVRDLQLSREDQV